MDSGRMEEPGDGLEEAECWLFVRLAERVEAYERREDASESKM